MIQPSSKVNSSYVRFQRPILLILYRKYHKKGKRIISFSAWNNRILCIHYILQSDKLKSLLFSQFCIYFCVLIVQCLIIVTYEVKRINLSRPNIYPILLVLFLCSSGKRVTQNVLGFHQMDSSLFLVLLMDLLRYIPSLRDTFAIVKTIDVQLLLKLLCLPPGLGSHKRETEKGSSVSG